MQPPRHGWEIKMKPIAAAVALCLFTVPAFAHEGMLHDGCPAGQTFSAGDISVTGAFSRAMLPNAPVGGRLHDHHQRGQRW